MDPLRSLYIPENLVIRVRYRLDKNNISRVKFELKEGTTLYESLLLFFHNYKQFPLELRKRLSRCVYVLSLSLVATNPSNISFPLPSNRDLVLLAKQWNQVVLPTPLVFTEFGQENDHKQNIFYVKKKKQTKKQEIQLLYYQKNNKIKHKLKLGDQTNKNFFQSLEENGNEKEQKQKQKQKQEIEKEKDQKKKKKKKNKTERDPNKSITNKVEFGLVQKMNIKFTRYKSDFLSDQLLLTEIIIQEESNLNKIISKENFQATIMLLNKDFTIHDPDLREYFECTPELNFPTVFEQLKEMKEKHDNQKVKKIDKGRKQFNQKKQIQNKENGTKEKKERGKENQKQNENQKETENSPFGKVFITKHSNFKNINLIFWIIIDNNDRGGILNPKIGKAISLIIKNTTKYRINKLFIPLKQIIERSIFIQQKKVQNDKEKFFDKAEFICKTIMGTLVLFATEKLNVFLSLKEIIFYLNGCKFDFESYFRKNYESQFI
ncbi:hypothetical protein M0812_20611 [Anaeramoeba flamelloides]|uniref:Uncharacterized protein n=1 Tax=Anaeramoeba flamelloides TaxID=1746091 RepID=A0AAV7YUU2_9EUKA|nr:hypothetical protein M0812_20611 [Anaeramoeba flamelloides]